MANKIQVRRDSQTNWDTTNPVLSQGEIGFSINENRIKVGDGTSTWSQLNYLASDTGTITDQTLFTNSNVTFESAAVSLSVSTAQLNVGSEVEQLDSNDYGVVSSGNSIQYSALLENISTDSTATTRLIIRPDSGRTNDVHLAVGMVSSSFSNSNRPVFSPNSGFVTNSKGNLVLGTADANTRVTFHVGGYLNSNVTGYVDETEWVFNRDVRVSSGQSGTVNLMVRNTLNDVQSKAQVELVNAADNRAVFGINPSNPDGATGNIGINDAYLHHSSNKTLHIGNTGVISFYTDPVDGFSGSPILQLTTSSSVEVNATLVPIGSQNLGSETAQWGTVYLSSSTFSVADTVVEVLPDNIIVGGTTLKDFSLVQTVPESSTSTGVTGQIALTTTSMYVCVGEDSWLRFDGVTF